MGLLKDKKCGPCANGVPPYTMTEIEPLLSELPGWEFVREAPFRLKREFAFKNFREAIAFVNRVADLAETEGHHPNISVHGWKFVTIELYTHKIGGLHENDFIVASKVGEVVVLPGQ